MTTGVWREVPCGHPPDPVAIRAHSGLIVCHCGWILDEVIRGRHVPIDDDEVAA